MKIGVLLSGCGVYDGAEIQESVLTLLAIDEIGAESLCISIDAPQHHVVNHATGEEMKEQRNMLVESARISRGNVVKIEDVSPADIDALVIPGGFGSAKNFSNWAFFGPNGVVRDDVKLLLVNLVNVGKPIVALCVSPVVLAKAFEGSSINPMMTIGSRSASSPYTIEDFQQGLIKTGSRVEDKMIHEILIDKKNRIITAPCYMMDASISQIRLNIKSAIEALNEVYDA